MGMTIDKAILRVEHSSMSIDDKETADFIINTMRKYQKIEQIFKDIEECELVEDFALDEIRKVLEDE